jgi:hypothetical protein
LDVFDKLQAFHARTEALRDRANASDELNEKLYYEQCYSGALNDVEALFCGINPGFSNTDWPNRSTQNGHRKLALSPCKYIEGLDEGWELSKAIVDVVLAGDAARLERCAETSLRSFFATPDEKTLARQFRSLSADWRSRHDKMMLEYLDFLALEIRPRRFICFGIGVFYSIAATLGLAHDRGIFSPDFGRRYFLKAEIQGIPLYGLIHLSGGRPTNGMKDWLREYFVGIT